METYSTAVAALGFVAALMVLQLLVADVLGILRKHVPGAPVTADHSDALFRATRAVANTNESIAIFICAFLFCVFSSASPVYTAVAAWAYGVSRALYLLCYYVNLQIARSICFGFSLLALVVLLLVGVFT